MKKPAIYNHLSDYEFALQQIINSLCIFIHIDGKELDVKNHMPLSICKLMRLNKLYQEDNFHNNGKSDYMINLNSRNLDLITRPNTTLSQVIHAK